MSKRGSKRVPVQARTVDVYQAVIDDVVSRVKGEFVQEGVDESVLDELRALWEQALQKTGVCDLPESDEESEGDETPAGGAPRPPASGAPAGAPPPGSVPLPPGVMPPGLYPGIQFTIPPGVAATPQAYLQAMHAQAIAHARATGLPFPPPPAGLVVPPGGAAPPFAMPSAAPAAPAAAPAAAPPAAAVTGQKRALEADAAAEAPPAKQAAVEPKAEPTIPQQDGPADDGAAAAAADEEAIGPGDSGDELGEADDLADVDDHEEIDEDAIKDVVLGQFEKVQRSKAKWRINLKNCIATIGGRDYVLKKVTGEMNFT